MSNENEDDLFGDESESDQSCSYNEEKKPNKNNLSAIHKESDIEDSDLYGAEDFFSDELNINYKNTSPFPDVECPSEKSLEKYE